MDFKNSADWTFPVPIYYGPSRVDEVPALCKRHEITRPLVVTDRGSFELDIIKNYSRISPNTHREKKLCDCFSVGKLNIRNIQLLPDLMRFLG